MIILGHILIIILSVVLSYKWITISSDKFINSESFRDSTKLGITITSIAFPLMISSTNYFTTSYFWSIIIVFAISTFLGLWNNFSIATLADGEGKIKVGKKNNNLMPTLLVLQFLYMLFGIFLTLKLYKKPEEKKVEKEKIYITSGNLTIGKTKNDLIKYWGIPVSEKSIGDTIKYTYINSESISSFKIYKDTIIEANERKLNSKSNK
jgi:hypothetical protein